MAQSPSPSHFGNNKYCVKSRASWWREAGSSGLATPAHPAPPRARPGLPAPSLCAQDDVDARICEHGPAHLPCPQRKGGLFERLLHLTWESAKDGVWGQDQPQVETGWLDGAPTCTQPHTRLPYSLWPCQIAEWPSWGWQGH